MTKDEALRLALEALGSNRRTHHYCEDTWYSCPKHEDGCANDSECDECNCGADKANAGIDQAITAIKAALEAKDEPVVFNTLASLKHKKTVGPIESAMSNTTPPQRRWVGLTDEDRFELAKAKHGWEDLLIAAEAKLKEKNT